MYPCAVPPVTVWRIFSPIVGAPTGLIILIALRAENWLSVKRAVEFIFDGFLTILICFNIYEFKKLPFKNKKQDLIIDTYQDDIKKLNNDLNLFNYKLVYNLKDSFDYIKSKKLAGNTYVIGTTYGFLPEIINGYTVKEILSTKKIIDKQNYLKKNKIDLVERLKKDKNIQAILITDLRNRAETIKKLKNNNWKLLKKFENSKYGSTVYLLVL